MNNLTGFSYEIIANILRTKTEDELQTLILQKGDLKKQLEKVFTVNAPFFEEKEDWRKFYQRCFGMNLNFKDVVIPKKPEGNNRRLLIIAEGLTLNRIYGSWTFPKSKCSDDLDTHFPTHVRTPDKGHYAVWVLDSVEPDPEFLEKSTRQADLNMEIGITLMERMILEAKYFSETGKNLDINNLTFCSGSLHSDGGVPGVCLNDHGEVDVGWYFLDDSYAESGIRRVVA